MIAGDVSRWSRARALVADVWELAWLPLALALAASGLTWTVWNFTTEPCTAELAKTTNCSLSGWARFINLDLLNKMFAHGAIAGGTGGVWSYVMLRRERQRAELAEQRAEEERQRADEERQRRDEERQRWDEERQRMLEQIALLTERTVNAALEQDSGD